MPLKFLDQCGSGNLSDAIEAILYSKRMGARISNNSWGGGDFDQALYDAIQAFGAAGGLFVAAAGNGGEDAVGDDNDATPAYPASYDLPNIIAVAATDRRDALAEFSNYGARSVAIAAPGVNIDSTVIGNAYDSFSGTSMATPHVAGIAALVKAQHPGLGVRALKDAVLSEANAKPALAGLMVTGGRANAFRALMPLFHINNVRQVEGHNGPTLFTFTVTLLWPSANAVTVQYRTANRSATAGSDYTARQGTLTFSAGQTSRRLMVVVSGDTRRETNEKFTVTLSGAVGGTLGDDTQGIGTILNDD